MRPPHLPEPRKPTLAPAWAEARARIPSVEAARREVFARLAELVDHAGARTAALQALFEREEPGERRDPWASLLHFIDADVTDLMRGVSVRAAGLVPGPGWPELADPFEARAEVELVTRYLNVAWLGASSPLVPPDAREVIHEAASALAGWGDRMEAVIAEIERILTSP
jgi:hypothetical protein